MYSLKEAAERTGKGKPAILKAIQKGRISAKKNELNEWEIDPAELHRVYPIVSGNSSEAVSSERQETLQETHRLQREIALLHERIADKDSVIDDLRRRLDQEAEERRKLTLILTDQREETVQEPAQKHFAWIGLGLIGLITGLAVLAMVFRESWWPLING